MQLALRLRIDLTYTGENLGGTFLRNTLAGDDLKSISRAGSPLPTPDVAAIQTNRDGRSKIRRRFDLELASGIEGELLGIEDARGKSLGRISVACF